GMAKEIPQLQVPPGRLKKAATSGRCTLVLCAPPKVFGGPPADSKKNCTWIDAPGTDDWNAHPETRPSGSMPSSRPATAGRAVLRFGWGPIGLIAALVEILGVPVATRCFRIAMPSNTGSPSARREPFTASAAPATIGVALEVPLNVWVYRWRQTSQGSG